MPRPYLAAITLGAFLLAVPAWAEDKVPTAQFQEILIKTSLLTLNDADLTGDFALLHAKLSKPFREQFTPEDLFPGPGRSEGGLGPDRGNAANRHQ